MTTASPALVDRPALGVALMIGFCLCAPLADATAKILAAVLPVAFLVLVRFAAQAAILLPLSLATGRDMRMSRRAWGLTAVRTALQVAGIWLMTTSLLYLPLADAIAIAFVMPFLLLLAGRLLLREEVGPHRIAACVAGFAGTLMVVQPAFAEVGWPALLPLGVAFVFTAFMLVTRLLARAADPVAMQAHSGWLACIVLLPALAMAGPLVPDGVAEHWPLLLLLGALGTFGHLLMTWSLRYAPSATLAPMQYLEIPIATLYGLLIFGDLPDGLAAVGIVVTVAAGLYTVHRERRSEPAV
jgi:drug/metabolite transporter (DMT)-like permease